jgi:hypothetical protein
VDDWETAVADGMAIGRRHSGPALNKRMINNKNE